MMPGLIVIGTLLIAACAWCGGWISAEEKYKPRRNQRGQFVR